MIHTIASWLVWYLMPDVVAYHAAAKVASWATVGKYGHTIVPELTALEAMDRWRKDKLS